jgi:hypothetical protein
VTRLIRGVLLAALGLALFAPAAGAAPIIRVQSVAAQAGSSGFFDVFLDIPAGDPPISLASFTLDLSTPAG